MGASRQDFQAIAKAIDWVYSKIDGKDFANRTKKEVGKLVAEEIAEQILIQKLSKLESKVRKKFDWYMYLPQEGKDVIINLCYQLGINGFSKFKKTIQHIINKDFRSAAVEMLQSKWASQTPNRAKKLSKELKYVK